MTRSMPNADAVVARVLAGLGEGLAYTVVLVGEDLKAAWVSPSCRQLAGYEPHELVGLDALSLVHPDDVDGLAALLFAEQTDPHPFGRDPASMVTNMFRLRTADGGWIGLSMAANNQLGNPDVRGIVLVLRDATAEQLTQEVLQRMARGEPMRAVVATVADLLVAQVRGAAVSIVVHGDDAAPVAVSHGAPPDRPADVVVPIAHQGNRSEVRVWLPDGPPATVWCRTLVERAADLVRLALTRDVGAAELRRAAHTDPLTGAHNRVGLSERLEMLAASTWGGLNAVLYVDLDDFKRVNDTWGHAAGDAVLVECARRLQACLRAGDVLARSGGDEFVAVCAGVPDARVAEAIARRIAARLGEPVHLPVGVVTGGASVGVAVGDRAATAGLTERADAALLRAKRAGKGRVEVDDAS